MYSWLIFFCKSAAAMLAGWSVLVVVFACIPLNRAELLQEIKDAWLIHAAAGIGCVVVIAIILATLLNSDHHSRRRRQKRRN